MQHRDSGSELFRQAVEDHYAKVRNSFGFLTRNRTEVEDLTQEVFVRLLTAIREEVQIQDVARFVRGIASNVFAEFLRRRKPVLLEESALDAVGFGDAENQSELTERAEALRALIGRLPPEEQTIIWSRYFFEQDSADISKHLNMPERTVRHRHQKALERLREWAKTVGLGR